MKSIIKLQVHHSHSMKWNHFPNNSNGFFNNEFAGAPAEGYCYVEWIIYYERLGLGHISQQKILCCIQCVDLDSQTMSRNMMIYKTAGVEKFVVRGRDPSK